ncbi:hypothetical protein MO973_01980 [Paenibacillus sp. TRM 82003]|nr:hypothetical protein [Paenibacillus sp. TRM 82003]
MSMKGVEMQIAVPRTNEATAIQNQLNQKPTHDQAALAQQNAKQTNQQRNRSAEVESSAFRHIRDEGNGASGRGGSSGKSRRGKKSEEANEWPTQEKGHPYKGKHIDISL